MSVVFHVSLVFLLLDKTEILLFEEVSLEKLLFGEYIALLEVTRSFTCLRYSVLVFLFNHGAVLLWLRFLWYYFSCSVAIDMILLMKTILDC